MDKLFYFCRQLRVYMIMLAGIAAARTAWGCACGCDIFDVGTSSMFPNHAGWMAYVDYDFQDQNQNWSGTSPAAASTTMIRTSQRISRPSACNIYSIPAGASNWRCGMIFGHSLRRPMRGSS